MKQNEVETDTWDSEHVKALLHFPRFPVRLIQQEPWQSWIGERGGLKTVIDYLQNYPLSPTHRRFLDVILATPEAVAEVYADQLNISRATYFYQLPDFIAALVQALNHWEPEVEPAADIETYFPPNLPVPLTDLVGAERTLQTLTHMIGRDDVRLLTLLGPGGIGKTRLSIELAHRFEGEACFVDLSNLQEPNQVVGAIAQTLGVAEGTVSALKKWLYSREFLLILDNFEQLLPAKSLVTALLTAAPYLKVIVTSRTALHIYGEHEFVVPPLELPDAEAVNDWPKWVDSPAVALFAQRAQAVNPNFVLNEENIEAVVRVCQCAEGVPWAIELAAFQVKYYSPQAMLKRLLNGRCLDFFNQNSKRRATHRQNLRHTLDWSFELLSPHLQMLFCQLSVFSGSFDIETAESRCGLVNVRTDLLALVDHSLLKQQIGADGEPCFQMVCFIREYAAERLSTL